MADNSDSESLRQILPAFIPLYGIGWLLSPAKVAMTLRLTPEEVVSIVAVNQDECIDSKSCSHLDACVLARALQ